MSLFLSLIWPIRFPVRILRVVAALVWAKTLLNVKESCRFGVPAKPKFWKKSLYFSLLAGIAACREGFAPDRYHRQRFHLGSETMNLVGAIVTLASGL
jgi:hypothetical protein